MKEPKISIGVKFGMLLLIGLILDAEIAASQHRALDIYANGYLNMLIIDPQGRRLGYDATTGQYVSEIPGGSTGAAGIDIVTEEGGEADSSQAVMKLR